MRIHILGVCGTFMGGIARLACASGHEVIGTDVAFYEPMASQLKDLGITCLTGYEQEVAKQIEADLHIVGNVIRRGNSLLEQLLMDKAKIISGPQWLAEQILEPSKHVIAVAGTHGKTTTASMVVHILEQAGKNPGYLIGGVPQEQQATKSSKPSAQLGGGDYFVIEADEYDTAFFDKRPKFTSYWADTYILNNIEFDHADIYDNIAEIQKQFKLLPRYLRPQGTIVANWADNKVQHAITEESWYTIQSVNDEQNLHWQDSDLYDADLHLGSITTSLAGLHNRTNALCAIAACHKAGIDIDTCLKALASFKLPARRLQVVFDNQKLVVLDDFAHHPTAIKATLQAVSEVYPDKNIMVAFEPSSNTMKSGHWNNELATCFELAEKTFVLDLNNINLLAKALSDASKNISVLDDKEKFKNLLLSELKDGDVLVMMSNGNFAGLRESLAETLANK